MLVEDKIISALFDDREEGFSQGGSTFKSILYSIFGLILMIIAGYLSWDCNGKQGNLLRIVYTVLAVIFSGIYLLFYLIYHVLLNNSCK